MSKLAHSNTETMRRIESDRLLEDDPSLYRCCCCGIVSVDGEQPCDCVTGTGFRRVKGKEEIIVWPDVIRRELNQCPTCGHKHRRTT